MFADIALGARIDRAEGRFCSTLARGGPANPRDGSMVMPISGGVAIFAGPSSPMNKVIGAGFDAPLDLEALAGVEAAWAGRQEPVRIELATLTDPGMVSALSDRGYRLRGFENVLARRLDDLDGSEVHPGIDIELVPDSDLDEWFTTAVDAFANMDGTGSVADETMPRDELERALREVLGAPGMTRYLARIEGRPAGEAALNVDDGLALLAGSGTAPSYRGRGVQKALVQRRLHDARRAGCDLAIVVTAPGSRSQDNVMRRGFELLYSRAILVR